MEQLTTNLTGRTRRERLHGRDFIVAPLSMMVSGVLNGSKGALYYPEDEINRNPTIWNHMPIVVNHPLNRHGKPISARHPAVIDKFGIGYVFNSGKNGQAEGWFDVEATRRNEPRILKWLLTNKPIELSTGLYTANHKAPRGASFNGKPYDYIARNYQPDHLAVLPDQTGACSLKDGCGVGVVVNNLDLLSINKRAAAILNARSYKRDSHGRFSSGGGGGATGGKGSSKAHGAAQSGAEAAGSKDDYDNPSASLTKAIADSGKGKELEHGLDLSGKTRSSVTGKSAEEHAAGKAKLDDINKKSADILKNKKSMDVGSAKQKAASLLGLLPSNVVSKAHTEDITSFHPVAQGGVQGATHHHIKSTGEFKHGPPPKK